MKHYIKLFKSFYYAFCGICSTVLHERNMRIHLTCVAYMLGFLLLTDWFTLTAAQWAVLLLACALVLSGELFNTAIENAVNMVTQEYNAFAKKAKDAASGAVLVQAIFAVAVGLVILYQPQAFKAMFSYFSENPLMFALFVLSIVPATLFIFFGFKKNKDRNP